MPRISVFYAITVTLNVSADELIGDQLPISIEEVCDVPAPLLGWRPDEDGEPVPTFATSRADITD